MNIDKKTLRLFFGGVCGCIVLYWLLHETERVKTFFGSINDVIVPFVFGGVLAFILNVPMRAIESTILKRIANSGLKRTLAVVLTFIALLLVVALVFWLLIPQIVETVNSLIPSLYDFLMDIQKMFTDFLNENPELLEWLKDYTDFENTNWESLIKNALSQFGNIASTVLGGAVSAIGSIFTALFNAVISIVFSVYCLFQKETLARQGRKILYSFTKEKVADNIIRILRLTNVTFSNFLSGQCVEVCILGIMFAISMAIFRMPYIPLISVVIAITAFIPIVGAWIGCVLGGFLIFVDDPMLAVWFVIMFLVIQQIENSMIYPRVVGSSVGLSGMWVLLAVAVGGELLGVLGMFLMIPLASVLYTLLRELTNNKLSSSSVEISKLQPHPPELSSKFKEKSAVKKNKKNSNEKSASEKKTEERD